ncbi:Rieske (2Fe-2S) protein [Legionella pneumophila serogroup 1]|uniref:Rieske (2Fe-2S) protein n=1 Tax=Legionella israelensis TaxID=454 RepID=UPI00117FC9FA|nr:Rieske (2Fe-2S) protein [Legionella israelensis]QDP73060.1 Rieske (2Fe-2S) protein [Legionella israelensis]
MEWKKALAVNDLDERKVVKVEKHKILFIKQKEKIHAVQHNCPHFKLPLFKGKITEDCAIICPFHKSAFDLETGDVKDWSPWPPVVGNVLGKISREKTLKVYPTKIEEGMILVGI